MCALLHRENTSFEVLYIQGLDGSQAFHELKGLLAPRSSRLESNHNEAISVPTQELGILRFFVLARSGAHSAIDSGLPGCAVPSANTRWSVMSTASWAPKNIGIPVARTSMALSSCAATGTFMSRSLVLHLTVAPAARHTLANAVSGASALVLSLPERAHAALCHPCPAAQRRCGVLQGNLQL